MRRGQRLRDRWEELRRTPWPRRTGPADGGRVAVVTVNYNTRALISHLVFSLHRIVGADRFGELVVVDNGSDDGSPERLDAAARAGLVHLIANRRQRGHGPALNQALSWLARREAGRPPQERTRYVWVLDSDVVVLRGDVVADAARAMAEHGAALLGQPESRPLLPLNSLLLDPALAWRPPAKPFFDHGDPSERLQASLRQAGRTLGGFPFRHHSYILHLGRGTLDVIAQRNETGHPLYGWAAQHHERHYGGHPFGRELHEAFLALYRRETGDDSDAAFVAACARPGRLTIPEARPLPPVEELQRLFDEGRLDELRRPSDFSGTP